MRSPRIVAGCVALLAVVASAVYPFGSPGKGEANNLQISLPCGLHFRDGSPYKEALKDHECEYIEAYFLHYKDNLKDFNNQSETREQIKWLAKMKLDAGAAFGEFQKAGDDMLRQTDPAGAAAHPPTHRPKWLLDRGADLRKFLDTKGSSSGGKIGYQAAFLSLPKHRRAYEEQLKALEAGSRREAKNLDKAERAKFEKRRKSVFEPDPGAQARVASRLKARSDQLRQGATHGALAETFGERGGRLSGGPGGTGGSGGTATRIRGSESSGGVGSASQYSAYQSGKDMGGSVRSLHREPRPYDAVVFYEPDGITHAAAGVILPDGRVVRQDAAILGVRPPVVYKNLDEARKNMSKEYPNAEAVVLPRKKLDDGKYSGEVMLDYMNEPRGDFLNTPYCSSYAATVLNKGGYDVGPAVFGSGIAPKVLTGKAKTIAKRLEEAEEKEDRLLAQVH